MSRRTLTALLIALVAVLTLGSVSEAATAKKSTRHRQKHSSRVSAYTGTTGTTTTKKSTKKKSTRKKTTHSTKSSHSTAKKRPPSTKPR